MTTKRVVRPDENLLVMQELEDRLQEQMDKLEHVRLAALDLKENLSTTNSDLSQAVLNHLDWLKRLSARVDTLHMNTTVFVQMNPKPRMWAGKHGSKRSSCLGHDRVQSEYGWSRTRRNSDVASEMSCNW